VLSVYTSSRMLRMPAQMPVPHSAVSMTHARRPPTVLAVETTPSHRWPYHDTSSSRLSPALRMRMTRRSPALPYAVSSSFSAFAADSKSMMSVMLICEPSISASFISPAMASSKT
jgi:hypothetical protein